MEENPIYKTRLRAKGQVTVPRQVRERLGLNEGDDLLFYVNEQGQIVVDAAQIVPPDQAWFWTERWQKMEREAQADIEAGRVVEFDELEEAIAALDEDEDAEDSVHPPLSESGP